MARNINVVVLTGNLTRDPDVRTIPATGTTVCKLGLAVNERYKDGRSGEWQERANFFDITVFGAQGEACGKYLAKGRAVAVNGRLRWESWEAEGGGKRSKVVVIADTVQFMDAPKEGSGGNGGGYRMEHEAEPEHVPAATGGGYTMGEDDFEAAKAARDEIERSGADPEDDIPF